MKPGARMSRNISNLEEVAVRIARKVLVAKAADVRKDVKASLKSGGKNRFSKTYSTSKPGEPPKTHGTRLKRSIRYEIESPDRIKVGAPSIDSSRTAGVLERGGSGSATKTTVTDSYFERRRKKARESARARKKSGASEPPKTKRAYHLESDSGQVRRVSKYERFKSEESAKKGTSAPEFQHWRMAVQKTRRTQTKVAARPFVEPAVDKESALALERARWERISRLIKNRG